ncbi:hypothetical protein MRX96_027782 [Rhipicephalus microplus]
MTDELWLWQDSCSAQKGYGCAQRQEGTTPRGALLYSRVTQRGAVVLSEQRLCGSEMKAAAASSRIAPWRRQSERGMSSLCQRRDQSARSLLLSPPGSRRSERVALGRLEVGGNRESRSDGEGASLAAVPTRKWAEPPTRGGGAFDAVGGFISLVVLPR